MIFLSDSVINGLDNFGTPEYNEPGSGGFVGDYATRLTVYKARTLKSPAWLGALWRPLNASNSRRYQLQMSDGCRT